MGRCCRVAFASPLAVPARTNLIAHTNPARTNPDLRAAASGHPHKSGFAWEYPPSWRFSTRRICATAPGLCRTNPELRADEKDLRTNLARTNPELRADEKDPPHKPGPHKPGIVRRREGPSTRGPSDLCGWHLARANKRPVCYTVSDCREVVV